jgi:D-amino peptidase
MAVAATAALLAIPFRSGSAQTGTSGQSGPKIYISADMEGLAGAVTADQLGPSGFEYGAYRKIMTEEVLAAIEGARRAGAGEIVVSDSHGNGENLLLEELPDDVIVIRSWPRPLMMMEGIDDSFDGVMFIGYHAGTTNPGGVRAHTMSSTNLTDLRINGRSHPEAGINAAIAGHFDVPVIMLSGDDAIAEEARAIIGDIEVAVVKEAISYHAARTMTPAAARELIRETAYRAVSRISEFSPYRVTYPLTMEVRFKNYRPGQVLALLPMFERIDAHAVRFAADDMPAASAVLEFILSYQVGLTP